MSKKLGPLPIWAWGLILGVAGYFLYERYATSSSSATAGTTGILDPNAVDPNTGLTYGEEEAAAMNADASQLGSSTGGGDIGTTDSGAQSTVTPTNEFGDFLTFLGEWNQFAQAMGWMAPGAASPTSTAAASSPPVQGSSPPTLTPAANTAPIQTGIRPGVGTAGGALAGGLTAGLSKVNNSGLLAPGARSPGYQLVRPSYAPSGALWGGTNAPGKNWRGIGGGWWVKK